ncbi:phage head closure protein [Cellulosilyticum lentocellum]|uniref:Phage head-tail adaptor n=1 Tax=Cellulosilyticum lentocellum (strain ATCC 49066 / DSM 5427 / NCIMB 11756 / RHM5) TaxID=642492 RepID=F2JPD1_CELLD|nr:phage head closure protein [Cellulosilyticum lentocellum]ADZ82479.1 phage head-tail adaptor [Cellulosilyticum lentocellum DSM 5427]
MWDEQIELIKANQEDDEAGDYKAAEGQSRKVFITKKEISQNEFYKAHSEGFKIALKFEMNAFEYENEMKVKYEGIAYNVIRTFQKDELIEITVGSETHGTT